MANQRKHNYNPVKCILTALVLFFASYHAISQNTASSDSLKAKKQPDPPADSSQKYGYGRLVLLGHVRNVPLQALPDSDGDGVPDQFDLEPNTPPGVAVDSRGRALDTDGDGVPDYKDKEKLTPQRCFPVDSNGVGTCPEPGCCVEAKKAMNDSEEVYCCGGPVSCNLVALPSIKFEKGSSILNIEAKKLLDSARNMIIENPYCVVKIFTSGQLTTKMSELQQQRVNAIMKYFIEYGGVLENRLNSGYHSSKGSNDTLDLVPMTDQPKR